MINMSSALILSIGYLFCVLYISSAIRRLHTILYITTKTQYTQQLCKLFVAPNNPMHNVILQKSRWKNTKLYSQ